MIRAALIVAAGRGTRARTAGKTGQSPSPAKQYAALSGKTVLARTCEAFLSHPEIQAVLVVIHPDDRGDYDEALAVLGHHSKLLEPALGGATRQKSVRAGLEALASKMPSTGQVLIHDAARPFVSAAVIDRVIDGLKAAPSAVAATQVADTLKRTDHAGRVTATIPRENLWRAQTPQGFAFPVILAAHKAAADAGIFDFTDDAAIAEWRGITVLMVPGEAINQKLTTSEDFAVAEKMLQAPCLPDVRVGNGFDVHKFMAGNHVWLGGVKIPHSQGVDAHSDGDVALHALTDALLGALGDGDIGLHFKNTDPRWKGASSDVFVADAQRRVCERNGRITGVDITILCEAPKIGPYREAMRVRIAEVLKIDVSRVGVKATTTEQLGFMGRGEGLAAMATATVVFGT